ncbi:hypothetical protein BS329_03895 [Amycolatopsis coloradensis]|uniref:Uncharacterized protein n=1 Tax=Amycolatopsis coloradensis TaxID=76021 RepID=A0A1R0L045_9PSEU|nr:hypothetical protein [Amycolatopsis coloradensis]OLZ55179.1 hypothetical protein BS329_03895 [Amycolatopsis coloradensis]
MADANESVVLEFPVQDGQYHIRASPGIDNEWPDSQFGLFVGEDNWIAVLCGTQYGKVRLTIQALEQAPAEIDQSWDMAAEKTLDCPAGHLTVQDLYSSSGPQRFEVAPGWIRLRISARHRASALARPEFDPSPVEHHLIQAWPTASQLEPELVYGPDEFARHYE